MSSLSYTQPANFSSPHEVLWKAILLRVIRDAEGNYCNITECAEARVWLMSETNVDRAIICDYTGVNESALVCWAKKNLKPLANLYPQEAERYNAE